jgi:hypothetical protein
LATLLVSLQRLAHRVTSPVPRKFLPFGTAGFPSAANVLSLLGTVLLAACAAPFPASDSDHGAGTTLGALMLSGPTFGRAALLPTVCLSGERQFFLGFDLHDKKAGVVTRLVVDPAAGPMVRIFAVSAPFDKTVLFHRAECRTLHFSLESTGWRVNRIDQLDVSLELDCQLPSGESIVGKASAPGCT